LRKADIYGGAGLLALGLIMLFVVIPAQGEGDTWSGVSPLFFPTVIATGFTLASAALLAKAVLRPRDYAGMEMPLKARNFGFFLVACVAILLSVLAVHAFGIVWGGPLLIAALMLFMGERNWKRILPMAVVPVVGIYLFVTKVLNAPLP